MQRYDRSKTKELHEFLYTSGIHDAIFMKAQYDKIKNVLEVVTVNHGEGTVLKLTFLDVKLLLSICDNKWGKDETILALVVEEDGSALKETVGVNSAEIQDCLYFLFQMFSANELHIICKELWAEMSNAGEGL